tara:strand:+ start:592 stop:792 length:201 start_codon:yes stop_codon:yes gene_type:complete
MTPKEKAKELYEKIYFLKVGNIGCWMFEEASKQCALICVDEMLKQPQTSDKQLNFLIEVKEEINKL